MFRGLPGVVFVASLLLLLALGRYSEVESWPWGGRRQSIDSGEASCPFLIPVFFVFHFASPESPKSLDFSMHTCLENTVAPKSKQNSFEAFCKFKRFRFKNGYVSTHY